MTCLLGNTESRTVYHNFHLDNLNSNAMDPSHLLYQRYLENQFFVPPGDTHRFFSHHVDAKIPQVPETNGDKGFFNVFPLSLQSDQLTDSSTASSLGEDPCFPPPPPVKSTIIFL